MELIKKLYAVTIERSGFREKATRIMVFVLPLFFWGHEVNWNGMLVAWLGVLIRAWGAGYLKKDQVLAQGGPYYLVRHPLYCGSVLLSLGLMLALNHWIAYLVLGGLTFLQYNHQIRYEETQLVARFGDAYREFQKKVGPLWPKPAGLKLFFNDMINGGFNFSFKQYMKNREYECLLGVLAVYVILYFSSRNV